VFRIGHLGDLNELMLLGALGGARDGDAGRGIRIEPGSGWGLRTLLAGQRSDREKKVARSEVIYACIRPARPRARTRERACRVPGAPVGQGERAAPTVRRSPMPNTTRPLPIKSSNGLRDATVAIINKVVLRDATLAQLPKLKLIAMAATGYDCIEVESCRRRGIALANIRNYAVHTVPEHVFAMVAGVAPQPARVPARCRAGRVAALGPVLPLYALRSGICSAQRSESSARGRSGRARRVSRADSG